MHLLCMDSASIGWGARWMCGDQYCLMFDQNGCSAFLIAAEEGHHECLSILLEHGAEVDKANRVSAVSVGDVACMRSGCSQRVLQER